ncbi:hypothetical protein CRUP_003676 [Coryphaenoides rupestris]|nr:hypothetical protein CRUP_003676 [Coryphaenoides rupestris]
MVGGYSKNCDNLETYWSGGRCVPCDMAWLKPGFEFSPNCGFVDDGGRREVLRRKCGENSFNDGTRGSCRRCTSCPPGRRALRPCNATADTRCCPDGLLQHPVAHSQSLNWNLLLAVLPSPKVQAAPLRMVLDDLDVLDELIILLDPESSSVKCTKHLASYCSFPSTWINYTYSMRDNKSPLKSVLEGVTTQHPDWTVGHLAKMLAEMGRNDAIIVLAKVKLNTDVV